MVSSRLLAKMLSMSEYELWCTLVGLSIVGVKLKLCKDKIKFWAYLQSWKRRRLILKSPIKKICLPEALSLSIVRSKYSWKGSGELCYLQTTPHITFACLGTCNSTQRARKASLEHFSIITFKNFVFPSKTSTKGCSCMLKKIVWNWGKTSSSRKRFRFALPPNAVNITFSRISLGIRTFATVKFSLKRTNSASSLARTALPREKSCPPFSFLLITTFLTFQLVSLRASQTIRAEPAQYGLKINFNGTDYNYRKWCIDARRVRRRLRESGVYSRYCNEQDKTDTACFRRKSSPSVFWHSHCYAFYAGRILLTYCWEWPSIRSFTVTWYQLQEEIELEFCSS